MAPTSDDSVGSPEIAKLLELLNESEAREETASQALQGLDEHEVIAPAPPYMEEARVELSADLPDAVENRFAAHIVEGMSKIKRD
jgi:hypothetical protein